MSATRKRNPEKMKKICSFVEEYFFKYHRSPTMQKIADELGVSKSTAYYYINEMADKGMLPYDGKLCKNMQADHLCLFTAIQFYLNEAKML